MHKFQVGVHNIQVGAHKLQVGVQKHQVGLYRIQAGVHKLQVSVQKGQVSRHSKCVANFKVVAYFTSWFYHNYLIFGPCVQCMQGHLEQKELIEQEVKIMVFSYKNLKFIDSPSPPSNFFVEIH